MHVCGYLAYAFREIKDLGVSVGVSGRKCGRSANSAVQVPSVARRFVFSVKAWYTSRVLGGLNLHMAPLGGLQYFCAPP